MYRSFAQPALRASRRAFSTNFRQSAKIPSQNGGLLFLSMSAITIAGGFYLSSPVVKLDSKAKPEPVKAAEVAKDQVKEQFPSQEHEEKTTKPDESKKTVGESEQDGDVDDDEPKQQSAYNPETGEINWDCPCLGGMANGPCGEEFKEAFSCFVYSESEPKGIDCIEKFQNMQNCFRKYPEVYSEEIRDDEGPLDDFEADKAPNSDLPGAPVSEIKKEDVVVSVEEVSPAGIEQDVLEIKETIFDEPKESK